MDHFTSITALQALPTGTATGLGIPDTIIGIETFMPDDAMVIDSHVAGRAGAAKQASNPRA